MDLAIKSVNSKTLTVADLLKLLPGTCDHTTTSDVTRYLQKAFFELLWKRSQVKIDNPAMVTYQSTGHVAQRVLLGDTPFSQVFRSLKAQPILGLIKARDERQDDMRFVLTVVKDEVTLLLENCAIDNKMSTLYVFDREAELFVSSPHGQLMAHLMQVGYVF